MKSMKEGCGRFSKLRVPFVGILATRALLFAVHIRALIFGNSHACGEVVRVPPSLSDRRRDSWNSRAGAHDGCQPAATAVRSGQRILGCF